ncbi:MAG: bifunctional enoyl-CoA hydratase/phosphate acetyltransferase [Oxalobacteraceae bacterium]|nr:bifunctional enoyl-CoA hydratase/phosphate acetyltransferase [Oxalobacteraceae bacterium]
MIENHPYADIRLGDGATLSRTLKEDDIALFAAMSGDVNPAHVDPEYAASTQFHGIIAHGMWGGALISTVLGTEFPGPGTIYLSQNLRFLHPVHVGDTLDVQVTVTGKDDRTHQVTLDCRCTDQDGVEVITGSAVVVAPTEKICRPRTAPMQVRLWDKTLRYRQLLALVDKLPPISVAVVHPCSEDALRGALDAAALGLITPILVGPEAKIRAIAASAGIDLAGQRIVNTAHSHAAAAQAVAMARAGEVQALMKGSLHTDELMAEVVSAATGLRTERHISHVYVLAVPSYAKLLFISDAAINIEPDLDAKRDIVRNAIDLAHAIGIAEPKVAILAAVETVNPGMRSTIDAAALCKMAGRGQITGGILDGPLAFDNAISMQAAHDKGIVSPVAGQADILIAPDLEAGNMIAKQLQYLADAQAAGLVLGARVPIILTSRADGTQARIASCALAVLMVKARA